MSSFFPVRIYNILTITAFILSSNLYAQSNYLLQKWTFNSNNQDSAALRSNALAATVPILNNLYESNGTTSSTVPAYSNLFGLACSPSVAGNGLWGTAYGGPGGSLSRTHFIEFTITANANYSVRIDSISMLAAFYGSSSNTKLAVVSSSSNFIADSIDVTGGVGPSGVLQGTANGAFATPIFLTSQSSGTTNYYSLALNGANGISISGGQSIKLRCYLSCGSTSAGRYALMKNFSVIGAVTSTPLPIEIVEFNGTNNNNTNILTWKTGVESEIDQYELEYSLDGKEFSVVKSVNSKNKTGSNYSVVIENESEVSFYRLKIKHYSSKITYSKTIQINSDLLKEIHIYPNPASEIITISFPTFYQNGIVRLYNLLGMIVDHKQLENKQSIQFNVQHLEKGTYYVQFLNENTKNAAPIYVQ